MKTKRNEQVLVLALVAIGLAIFAFVDLNLSIAVNNPNSIFGLILEAFGEWPAFLAGVLGGAMLLLYPFGKGVFPRIISRIGGVLLLLFSSSLAALMSFSAFKIKSTVGTVVLMIVLIGIGLFAVRRIPEKYRRNARQAAMLGVVLFIATMIVFNIIKMGWGRMRFRDMVAPYAGFTPWYLPQGFTTSNSYMSFPSGHAAWASVLLIITALPLAFPSLKNKAGLLNIIAFTWIILVSFSRIIVGAHFASDVTVGFLITWILFQLWQKVFLAPKRLQTSGN